MENAEEKGKPYFDKKRNCFAKGNPGRPKGSGTKPFISLKHSFLDAFNDPRIGGIEGMIEWVLKKDDHRAQFYTWLTKMLPRTVDIQGVDPVTPTNLSGLKDEELDSILLGMSKVVEGRQNG